MRILALLLALIVPTADAAITFVRSGGFFSGTGSTGFSFDIGTAGTNRLVTVIVATEEGTDPTFAATVDGNNCTGLTHETTRTDIQIQLFYCNETALGPSAGSVTVACTGGECGTNNQSAMIAMLHTGVGAFKQESTGNAANNAVCTTGGHDTSENGVVIFGVMNRGNGGTFASYTSPVAEQQDGSPSAFTMAGGEGIESSAQTAKTYSATYTGGTAAGHTGCVVASWDEEAVAATDAAIIRRLTGEH